MENKARGQVIIEYVLLVIIALTLAMMTTRALVRRDTSPDNQGFVIQRWIQIWKLIGEDRTP